MGGGVVIRFTPWIVTRIRLRYQRQYPRTITARLEWHLRAIYDYVLKSTTRPTLSIHPSIYYA